MSGYSDTTDTTAEMEFDTTLGIIHATSHQNSRRGSQVSDCDVEMDQSMPGRPRNFGVVIPGLYRSGFPKTEDYDYLQSLGLKTIITLVQKDYPEGFQAFMQSRGIRHVVIEMAGTKKIDISEATMNSIMQVVLDRQNHPILMHCNQGKHRTGCAVAVIRKVMGWTVDEIVEEYSMFAKPKIREVDIKYIHGFDIHSLQELARRPERDTLRFLSELATLVGSTRMFRTVLFIALVLFIWGITVMDLHTDT